MTAFRIQNEISFFKIAKIGYEIQSEFPHPLRSLKDDEQLVQKAITFINHSKNTDFLIGTDGTITECVDGFYEQKNLSSLFFAHSDFFKKLYYDMGLLDAYIVLARMHKTYEHPFSHYSNHKSAFLKIVEGLHPNVLNEQTSIRNNFMHGDSIDKPIVVVSGKNGSGKSFNIKMIILNVWLAQTIGFTLTKEACILTPFDYFKIHANISDSDYYSKFQTEGTEIAQLIEKSANLEEKGKKCFILFDEPLSTTSAFFGEPILNALISILDNHKHSLLFIITHLHGILTNKTVRQMSIKVIQNADGTFTSTRKFQEGPSYDNDAPYFIANKLSPLISQEFLKAYHAAFEKK